MPIRLEVSHSNWEYKSATGGGITVLCATAGGGVLTLKAPDGSLQDFRYGSLGPAFGEGLKLPRIGKLKLEVTGANGAFDSGGYIFQTNAASARTLTREDFRGPCVIVEAGAGLVAGVSGSAMLFGLDSKLLAMAWLLSSQTLTPDGLRRLERLLRSARGAIFAGGFNAGVQAGGGISLTVGGLF